MGFIVDFARITWNQDTHGMAWAANCGATSNPKYALRTLELAAQSLRDHFEACKDCQGEAMALNE